MFRVVVIILADTPVVILSKGATAFGPGNSHSRKPEKRLQKIRLALMDDEKSAFRFFHV
jgi:hypothetical protein